MTEKKYKKAKGFAILIVLVAVAILLLLYFVQIDAFFSPGLPSEPKGIEEHPWVLEELLIELGEDITLPRRPKLLLNEPVRITAPVLRKEADRGTIDLAFNTDGTVSGQWQCSYSQSGTQYQIDAEMKGTIDVKRTYRDEQGKDKSKLFFIAKGKYTKTPLAEAASGGEKGTAWLIGWIGPDGSTTGHVTITQNRQWAAAYTFQGRK